MTANINFYGDVLYVMQFRRHRQFKFADWGWSSPDGPEALSKIEELRTSEKNGREYRLICRATNITEIEMPV